MWLITEMLLEFAAIDPGEPKFNQEIDLISDYDNTQRIHCREIKLLEREEKRLKDKKRLF